MIIHRFGYFYNIKHSYRQTGDCVNIGNYVDCKVFDLVRVIKNEFFNEMRIFDVSPPAYGTNPF